MHARKINPDEVMRTEELFSVSFDSPYSNELSPMELYDKYRSDPQNREQEYCLERFAAFEDDDKTMTSCFITQPFSVFFDGSQELMYSIGGVATLPQHRKRGGIRMCFEKALPYMYEKEAAFSYLYPFSTAYYRKFGYELCCSSRSYQIVLSHIPAYSTSGSCYLLEPATAERAAKDIPYIYDTWQCRYNMMVEGTPYDYRFIESANPFKDQIFTYVCLSSDGEPSAYMTFRCDTHPEHRILECSRFIYKNAEGLKGLLSLAKGFASDYRHIRFSLPDSPSLEPVFPEWSMGAVECKLIPNGMVRVIRVKKVLEDARYIGSGSISLEITDPFIRENNGIFQVDFSEGRCTAITDTAETADIRLSISSFSTLITGGYDTNLLSLFPDVQIHCSMDKAARIFYKKPVYIATYF